MLFSNCQVTALLRTPVVSDAFLPLDGLLWYAHCRLTLPPQDSTVSGQPSATISPDSLPLAALGAGDDWYYAGSFAQPRPWWLSEGQDAWNKRFDLGFASLIDFRGRRATVETGAGRYKAYHMPLFYRTALEIHWYGVGDLQRIEQLLRVLTHIGKKSSQGWGRVRQWRVEPWAEDWSCWRAGQPTRAIPEVRGTALYGIRPSYYVHAHLRQVLLPP